MIVLRHGQQAKRGGNYLSKNGYKQLRNLQDCLIQICLAQVRFHLKGFASASAVNFLCVSCFSKFLKPLQLDVVLGSTVKSKTINLHINCRRASRRGQRQKVHQWKQTSKCWSELILYMSAAQEPWHFSCQSSFTLTHPASFEIQCDNSSIVSLSVLCFKAGLECEEWLDETRLWQMVPHWDVGRRIYCKGRMLLLNLRRCTVLPFYLPFFHCLFVILLSVSSLSFCFLSLPFPLCLPHSFLLHPSF